MRENGLGEPGHRDTEGKSSQSQMAKGWVRSQQEDQARRTTPRGNTAAGTWLVAAGDGEGVLATPAQLPTGRERHNLGMCDRAQL